MADKSYRRRLTKEENEAIEHKRDVGFWPGEQTLYADHYVEKVRIERNNTKDNYKRALKKIENLEERLDIFEYTSNAERIKHNFSKNKSGSSESVMFALLSDIHYEENIDPTIINGVNEYNIEIAKTRLKNYFSNLVYMAKYYRTRTKLDTLVLAFLGDFITGYIHEEFEESNNLSPLQAFLDLIPILTSGIDYVIDEGGFSQIVVPCAYGNHSRTTKDKRYSTGYKNSYEWALYNLVANNFQDEDIVEFNITKGIHTYFNAFDKYKVRFHHGDHVPYSNAIGGIATSVAKAVNRWEKKEPIKVYLDAFGHHHTYQDGGFYLGNGSMCGFTAYGDARAGYEEPKQMSFLIERDHGKTDVAPIFLD